MKGKHGASAERRREQAEAVAAVEAAERRAKRAEAEALLLADKLRALDERFQQEVRELRRVIAEQRPPALIAAEEENVKLSERLRLAERRVESEYRLSVDYYNVAARAMEAAGIDPMEADRLLGGANPESKFLKGERGQALLAARAKGHGGVRAVIHSSTALPTKAAAMLSLSDADEGR